jgi:acetylornithine deacetylase/succinyl-diaminopimelate desuccinylase-like protein
MAHTVDEYIELADLETTARGYLSIIESVCNGK